MLRAAERHVARAEMRCQRQNRRSLLNPVPLFALLPGEDQATFDTLRTALLSDLAPQTPYEHALAENLVGLEWEVLRHRRLQDALLRAEYRQVAAGVFLNGAAERVYRVLVSDNRKARASAEAALAERGITFDEILAEAYKYPAKDVVPHEQELAEIEVRRRRLREDYDQLTRHRLSLIDEAEIVDA